MLVLLGNLNTFLVILKIQYFLKESGALFCLIRVEFKHVIY